MTTATTTQPSEMSPSELAAHLAFCEVDYRLDSDCRQILRDERHSVEAAIKSGSGQKIAAAKAEAVRVLNMWTGIPGGL